MQTRKPSGLVSRSGLLRLVGQAAMGIAMGLAFPSGSAIPVEHGGNQATTVFVGTLVLTFGIGAALTGAVFIMTEDD